MDFALEEKVSTVSLQQLNHAVNKMCQAHRNTIAALSTS